MKIQKPSIMFILHVPPPIHGAAMMGKYLQDSKLINAAFDCHFLNLSTSEKLDEIGQGGLNKFLKYLNVVYNVLKYKLKHKPKLVYMTPTSKGVGFYKDALIAILLRLLGSKMVYHFHNKGVALYQHKFFDNLLYKLVFRKSRAIVLSKRLIFDIEKYFLEKDIYICPNGIPAFSMEELMPKKKTHKEILFLSNLLIAKGILVLLDACKILKERGIMFTCKIVGAEGDVSASTLKERIHELYLSEHVNYLGKRYGNEKLKSFLKADIFVLPTLDEAFPLVLLEAMQFGLPIVSTDVGGIADIVTDFENGLIVPLEDSAKLAQSLELLLNNTSLIDQMSESGREKYFSNFTLEKFENRMYEILNNLVK